MIEHHSSSDYLLKLITHSNRVRSSNTPITYEIVCDIATKVDPSAGSNNYFKNKTPPFMALLQDTVISIHVQPNGMPPVVEIDQYNIHSIVQFANK